MKFIKYLTVLWMALTLAACGGGGGAPGLPSGATTPVKTTAPASFLLSAGTTQSFSIIGGRAPYQISSSNSQVAVAVVDGGGFWVGGVSGGTANIVVSDVTAQSVTIAVTVGSAVTLYTTAPSSLTMVPGSSRDFVIGGGQPPYTVVSDNTLVATTDGSGGTVLRIVSNKVGTANVKITDAASAIATIGLSVTSGGVALYTTAPSSLTMVPGSSRDFVIGGGQPPYTVVSDNTFVATTDGSGGTVLRIVSKKAGTANVKITDAVSATTSIGLNVTSGGVALALSPTSATTFVDLPVDVFVIGGTPPYRVGGLIPAAAGVVQDPVDKTKFIVTPFLVSSGMAISFLDSENAIAMFTLTVNAGQPTFRLSPNALSLAEKFSTPFNLTTFGATDAVNAFSSDLTLFSVAVSGNTVKVTPTGKCVASDTSVTITAVDSNQAVATTIITVVDNGNTEAVAADGEASAILASDCPS